MISIDIGKENGIYPKQPEKLWDNVADLLNTFLNSGYLCSIARISDTYYIDADYSLEEDEPERFNYWLTNEEATLIDEKRMQERQKEVKSDESF